MTQPLHIRLTLRIIVLGWLAALLIAPVSMVFLEAFDEGFGAFAEAVTTPTAVNAMKVTAIATAISVMLNVVFGVQCALVIVRGRSRLRGVINAVIDIPFAISPVVIGLALLLTFGANGWFGEWFIEAGIPIIFSIPGIVIATVFVTLPFVVREVVPVLQEIGDEQEQAAATLGASGWRTFWHVTLPSIRWGVSYGVVLTVARALGEYGAVAVVSGRIVGHTETMTIHINESYARFDYIATYGAALLLAAAALFVLGAMTALASRGGDSGGH